MTGNDFYANTGVDLGATSNQWPHTSVVVPVFGSSKLPRVQNAAGRVFFSLFCKGFPGTKRGSKHFREKQESNTMFFRDFEIRF